jgi:hypothetical protein
MRYTNSFKMLLAMDYTCDHWQAPKILPGNRGASRKLTMRPIFPESPYKSYTVSIHGEKIMLGIRQRNTLPTP